MDSIITVPKKDIDGKKIYWSRIRWMRFTKEDGFTMLFKETLNKDAEFRKVAMYHKNCILLSG